MSHRLRAVTIGLTATLTALMMGLSPTSAPLVAEARQTSSSITTSTDHDHSNHTATPAELSKQREQAIRLASENGLLGADVQQAHSELARLAEAATAAMEAQTEAEVRRADALTALAAERARLAEAQRALALRKSEMGRWATESYKTGTPQGVMDIVSLISSASTDELGRDAVMVRHVGKMRGVVVNAVTQAEIVQRDATEKAEHQEQLAAQALEAAKTAREEADQLVADQRALLASLETAEFERTRRYLGGSSDLASLSIIRGIKKTSGSDNAVTGEVGQCIGGDIVRYANGQIPRAALCPLAAHPTHSLRADAAYAFDKMSAAYEAEFGEPICITDSYRPLAQQISVKLAKPHLAATPGTSNHGWGTALDLCGGIQVFASPAHQWMRANSVLFGWYHPRWAQQNGSKPEAWHWEFAG